MWEGGGQRKWIRGIRIESELQIIEGECVEKFFLWCERVLFQEFLFKNFKPFYVSDHIGDDRLVRDCGAIQIEFLASLLKKVLKLLLDQFVILFGHDYQDTALSKKSKMSSEWLKASPFAKVLHWDDLSPTQDIFKVSHVTEERGIVPLVDPPQIFGSSIVVVQVPLNYVHVLGHDLADLVLPLARLGIERELMFVVKLGDLLMALIGSLHHLCLVFEA